MHAPRIRVDFATPTQVSLVSGMRLFSFCLKFRYGTLLVLIVIFWIGATSLVVANTCLMNRLFCQNKGLALESMHALRIGVDFVTPKQVACKWHTLVLSLSQVQV